MRHVPSPAAHQAVRPLRPHHHLAQGVGPRLGLRALVLRQLPQARPDPVDLELEDSLESLLDARARDASVCPSEAATRRRRADDWRELMEPARSAARRLVAAGRAEITQGGQVIDPDHAKGPIRVRRPR